MFALLTLSIIISSYTPQKKHQLVPTKTPSRTQAPVYDAGEVDSQHLWRWSHQLERNTPALREKKGPIITATMI